MADVQISEVDAKPAPVSLGKSRVKFGNHCWATQESTVVQQWVSLFKPTADYRNIGCCHIFMANLPLVAIGDSVSHPGSLYIYPTRNINEYNKYCHTCNMDSKNINILTDKTHTLPKPFTVTHFIILLLYYKTQHYWNNCGVLQVLQ
jgi:hypothetical protein